MENFSEEDLVQPYYDEGNITIYHGDALEVMPLLQVPVDLVLADPDYNGRDIGKHGRNYTEGPKHQLPDADYAEWCQRWFSLAQARSDRIALTPGLKNLWNYPPAKWCLCWYKPGAVSYNKTGGFNIWEPVLVYGNCPRIIQDAYAATPLNFMSRDGFNEHPCPKHPGFWSWVLSTTARAGETILDPFLGSGTTARAGKKLGMKVIGIELEERYCELAANSVREELRHEDILRNYQLPLESS